MKSPLYRLTNFVPLNFSFALFQFNFFDTFYTVVIGSSSINKMSILKNYIAF